MTVQAVAAVAAAVLAALAVAGPGRTAARARALRLLGRRPAPGSSGRVPVSGRQSRPGRRRPRSALPILAPVAAAAAVALWVPGAARLPVALGVGAATAQRLRRHAGAAARAERAVLLQQLPLAVRLLAACVDAGAEPVAALDAVAAALGPPLDAVLAEPVAAVRLGEERATAFARWQDPPELAALGRVLIRAGGGAPPGPALRGLAEDLRLRRRWAGEAAARRAGVAMAGPLGLCFLPAFVLLGVVPLVAGLVGGLGVLR